MANYKIITDEVKLRQFIEWLPELKPEETYYVCLFARSKYCKDIAHISSDKQQVARFLTRKNRMFDKIKQLEVELGAYKQYKKDVVTSIPQESLALYITANPRNTEVGARRLLKALVDKVTVPFDTHNSYSLHQLAISEVHKASTNRRFVMVDFDDTDLPTVIEKVEPLINQEAVTYLKTRGGVHVIVTLSLVDPQYKKSWYVEISKLEGVDQQGDLIIPVPGTYQGGFTPYLFKH